MRVTVDVDGPRAGARRPTSRGPRRRTAPGARRRPRTPRSSASSGRGRSRRRSTCAARASRRRSRRSTAISTTPALAGLDKVADHPRAGDGRRARRRPGDGRRPSAGEVDPARPARRGRRRGDDRRALTRRATERRRGRQCGLGVSPRSRRLRRPADRVEVGSGTQGGGGASGSGIANGSQYDRRRCRAGTASRGMNGAPQVRPNGANAPL